MENRRQFTRILFSTQAELEVEKKIFPVSIHDISLNGALITLSTKQLNPLKRKLGILRFTFGDNELAVTMHIAIVHEQNNDLGLQCNGIDIDSISHLRRMIELNLGDEKQLHKELSQLNKTL
jgi:hypothetical protein